MIAVIHKVMAPLRRSIGAMVNRAVVHLVNNEGKTQLLQVEMREDEVRDEVEYFQPAGFVSVPLPGAEAIVLAVQGNGDHRIAVVVHDKRSRPTGWQPGEVGLYNLTTGDLIRFKADGSIDIRATAPVTITAPTVRIVGNLEVSGQVSDAQGTLTEMRAAHNTHNHPPEATAPPSSLMV